MILSEIEKKEIIKSRPNKALVEKARKLSKELQLHINGEGVNRNLEIIEGLEDSLLNKLRVKYGKSNKDQFTRLRRPLDKVFSARGGSVYYSLEQAKEAKARGYAANIRDGYSLKDWTLHNWLPHYLDDPNGIILLEIEERQQALQSKQSGNTFVYPTYVSTSDIYDYKPKGTSLDYLVTKLTDKDKKQLGIKPEYEIYRIIDDATDALYRYDGQFVTQVPGSLIANYFGSVPAIQCSDIPHTSEEGLKVSFFDPIMELAAQSLVRTSVKFTHELLHGFPKYWQYAPSCAECKGTGLSKGDTCGKCGGSGKSSVATVSDVLLLSHPNSKEDPIIAPNVAGYISPDKIFWEIATAEMADAEDKMTFTLYGVGTKQKTQGASIAASGTAKTATEIMDDIKPQADRLYAVSAQAEKVHKFILDNVIKLNLSAPNYPGSLVNYGRRYMIEGPDALWDKYSNAKKNKAPVSALDDLYSEYLEAKFTSDPMKLAIQLKLSKVEPFFHMTSGEVVALNPGEEDYKAKLYFGEWLSQTDEMMLLSASITELKAQLYDFTNQKQIVAPAKPVPAIP